MTPNSADSTANTNNGTAVSANGNVNCAPNGLDAVSNKVGELTSPNTSKTGSPNGHASNGNGDVSPNGQQQNDGIDEGLYSRQLYVLGKEAMKQMAHTKTLISGMNGVGLEAAKCLVLGGMKEVTMHDCCSITEKDLSSNYYATPEDIGRNRAEVVKPQIAALNSYVQVRELTGELSEEIMDKYDMIIFCPDHLTQKDVQDMDYCHSRGIKYTLVLSNGVFGACFNDFGRDFIIADVDGNDPFESFIEGITYDEGKKEVTVICHDDKPHGLGTGYFVEFEQLTNVTQLNGIDPVEITYISPLSFKFAMPYFKIDQLNSYSQDGLVREVKMPKTVTFNSFEESLQSAEIMLFNFGKMNHSPQIVASYLACAASPEIIEILNRNAEITQEDCDKFAKAVEAKLKDPLKNESEMNRHLSDTFLRQYQKPQFAPMCAVFGSIAAQEAMKAVTHKFSPIQQWFALDAIECVSEKAEFASSACGLPVEAQILGKHVHNYLASLKMFLVGSGAIGCELLKLFALMNVATSTDGLLTVTDMDTIERSNLNRQFLFRPENIGDFKSSVASAAAQKINPKLNIKALTDAVGLNTENIFDFEFYKSLDLIVNALDNVETRRFTDSKCVFFNLPLLESGTLGTKGNTQVVVPGITESYSSSNDQPEVTFPMCTIKNFPYTIQHTIPWARDFFESKFVLPSKSHAQFTSNPNSYLKELQSMQPSNREPIMESLKCTVLENCLTTFEQCISSSIDMMVENYHDNIVQMQTSFPEDHITSTGTRFWSGLKRYPRPMVLDICNCKEQYNYVESASCLFAQMYGIELPKDIETAVKTYATSYKQKEFKPNSALKIAANDNELEEMQKNSSSAHKNISNEIADRLAQVDKSTLKQGEEIEFEKDDATNHQIDFITAASNLRALNYSIKPISHSETKRIAGKIIPAIATTTSLVAGLVAIELCKLAVVPEKEKLHIEKFCNTFINLSLPFLTQSEPMPCPVQEYKNLEKEKHTFTLWDKIEMQGEMTLRELLQYFKNTVKVNVSMISCGTAMIYADFMQKTTTEEVQNTLVSTLVENLQKHKFDINKEPGMCLNVIPDDVDDEEVEIPYVYYAFDKSHSKWNFASSK